MTAPPVKGEGVGDAPVVVVFETFEAEPGVSTKFAHVNREVLEVWITMERLPMKAPMPSFVEL